MGLNSTLNQQCALLVVPLLEVLYLRDTQRTSIVLNFNDSNCILRTKDTNDNKLYESYQKNANCAKDLLSVIIDRAKQSDNPIVQQVEQVPFSPKSGIADEIAKLAQLKADGILTDEEFNTQKAKLLNL